MRRSPETIKSPETNSNWKKLVRSLGLLATLTFGAGAQAQEVESLDSTNPQEIMMDKYLADLEILENSELGQKIVEAQDNIERLLKKTEKIYKVHNLQINQLINGEADEETLSQVRSEFKEKVDAHSKEIAESQQNLFDLLDKLGKESNQLFQNRMNEMMAQQ